MNITTVISIFPMHTIWKKFPLNLVCCQGEKKEEKERKKERGKEREKERRSSAVTRVEVCPDRQTDRPTLALYGYALAVRCLAFGCFRVRVSTLLPESFAMGESSSIA